MVSSGPGTAEKVAEPTTLMDVAALVSKGATWHVERMFPFFNSIKVTGWMRHPATWLSAVAVVHQGQTLCAGSFREGPESQTGAQAAFDLSALFPGAFDMREAALVFKFADGTAYLVRWEEIVNRRTADACHELSTAVAARRFDGIYSVSTFEHLLMPWKVALEINRVLRPGGVCFIHTHQALGMHDMPWDFWRFSDTAWHALFNKHTGFEILGTHLEEPMHLVPTVYTDHWNGYEGSLGFATSSVLVRKTAETTLRWDVPAHEVAVGVYPE